MSLALVFSHKLLAFGQNALHLAKQINGSTLTLISPIPRGSHQFTGEVQFSLLLEDKIVKEISFNLIKNSNFDMAFIGIFETICCLIEGHSIDKIKVLNEREIENFLRDERAQRSYPPNYVNASEIENLLQMLVLAAQNCKTVVAIKDCSAMVCTCMKVTHKRLEDTIVLKNITQLTALVEATQAGTVCKSCVSAQSGQNRLVTLDQILDSTLAKIQNNYYSSSEYLAFSSEGKSSLSQEEICINNFLKNYTNLNFEVLGFAEKTKVMEEFFLKVVNPIYLNEGRVIQFLGLVGEKYIVEVKLSQIRQLFNKELFQQRLASWLRRLRIEGQLHISFYFPLNPPFTN